MLTLGVQASVQVMVSADPNVAPTMCFNDSGFEAGKGGRNS